MCCFIVRAESMMNPRFLAESEKVMSEEQTVIEVGRGKSAEVEPAKRRASVLSSFNLSMLVVIQLLMSVVQF
jgi:hypothetical protein